MIREVLSLSSVSVMRCSSNDSSIRAFRSHRYSDAIDSRVVALDMQLSDGPAAEVLVVSAPVSLAWVLL